MLTKKEIMIAEMTLAIKNKQGYVVWVKVPGTEKLEVIKNPYENLITKRDYYNDFYNDDLELKHNTTIRIERHFPVHSIEVYK